MGVLNERNYSWRDYEQHILAQELAKIPLNLLPDADDDLNERYRLCEVAAALRLANDVGYREFVIFDLRYNGTDNARRMLRDMRYRTAKQYLRTEVANRLYRLWCGCTEGVVLARVYSELYARLTRHRKARGKEAQ